MLWVRDLFKQSMMMYNHDYYTCGARSFSNSIKKKQSLNYTCNELLQQESSPSPPVPITIVKR